jgi:hypothetical protein
MMHNICRFSLIGNNGYRMLPLLMNAATRGSTTLSIMMRSITTVSITTHGILKLSMTTQHKEKLHYG